MRDRFESAWQKIKRARKHADDLEAEVSAFWAADPCEIEMVGSPMTGSGSYRVTRVGALPESISLIAGDAAHNIRSALDHFACAAVPSPDRATAFPVWSTSKDTAATPTTAQWKRTIDRQLRGASPGLIEAFLKLEAWETGSDYLLWAIHELDRVDKHRLLISIAVANTTIRLDGDSYVLATVKRYSGFAPDQPLALEPKWTPLRKGTVLFNTADGSVFGAANASFSFDVTLGEPSPLRGQSAVGQLRILAGVAEKAILRLASFA
jgi:hypothetical protein